MHLTRTISAAAFCALLLVVGMFVQRSQPAYAQTQSYLALTGWAWSDTIGWISFSCENTGTCQQYDYGVNVGSDGTLSGYAWSDNIGWLSANSPDIAGCPWTPCQPRISGDRLVGWLKALAGGTAQSGGWDGWVSLSGLHYGVVAAGSGMFSGFAWGSDVVGWTNFSLVRETTRQCLAVTFCQDGKLYHGDPAPACFSSAQLVQACSSGCAASGTSCNGSSSCAAPHNFCEGNAVYYGDNTTNSCKKTLVRSCPWQCVGGGCYTPQPSITTWHVAPLLLKSGEQATVTWSAINVDSCKVSGTNGDKWSCTGSSANNYTCVSPESGQPSSPITAQTIYTITCDGHAGANPPLVSQTATVNIAPVFNEQ